MRIYIGYLPWFTLTEPVAVNNTNERELALKYILSLCVLSISHILSGSLSLSHHLSPKGRILEESLIIFTAHSIIPAKRLIHDLPQRRPTPASQGEGEAKQERKSALVQKNIYILSGNFHHFEFSCGLIEIHIPLSKRKETCRDGIYVTEDLQDSLPR